MIPLPRDPAQKTAVTAAAVVGSLALVVLVPGWLLDVRLLRDWGIGWSPMAPFTAVLLALVAGGVIWFRARPRLANAVLLTSFALAASMLVEWEGGSSFGYGALMRGLAGWHNFPTPELAAPDTLAAIILMVITLACMRTGNRWLHDFGDVTAIVIGTVCLQVLIGYTYNLELNADPFGFRQIAPHSTVLMMALAFSAVAWRPTPGLISALSGTQPSAQLLRRLLPITLVVSILFGSLLVLAIRSRIGPVSDLIAWAVTGYVVVLSIVVFVTSAELRAAEKLVERRQEELLAAMMTAEAASAAKSRFMAVMSHELRTPLTAVIGYVDLLEAGVAGPLPPEANGYMHRIRASGWHLAGLIDAVLFYAGDQLPAEHAVGTRVSIDSLVRDVSGMFETHARDKGITLELQTTSAEVTVSADERKLRQVLVNLLSNAVKFTEHGSITVTVRTTTDRVLIDVADTGIGMDSDHVSRIWEPFQMADASHTRERGGMGLGLAVTQRLAEQLNAVLSVRSELGQGTTFTLELPLTRDAPQIDGALPEVSVLVVDDEPSVRRIMARTLGRSGATVSEAESAKQALELLENGAVDVVVTDISMPGMTGIQLAEAMQMRELGIPVLFVTGAQLDAQDQARIAAVGGRLLHKPFESGALTRAVRTLIV